jgi:hypothetical protein
MLVNGLNYAKDMSIKNDSSSLLDKTMKTALANFFQILNMMKRKPLKYQKQIK